jgi:hypothetical protein
MKNLKNLFLAAGGVLLISGCSASREYSMRKVQQQIMAVEAWGGTPAVDSLAKRHTIQYITLHHGGEPFPKEKDPIQYLRGLQKWSRTEKHWIDIPYHYIIDLQGKIYAGRDIRYAGDTNTEYDPAGHALICVVGNYEEIQPNEHQLRAVVFLMTMLTEKYGVSSDHIKGHLDYSKMTVCPGKNLYPYLANGYFQHQVDSLMAKK